MALESKVSVTIEFAAVPFLPGAVDLAADGVMPGGSRRNLAWALEFVDVGAHDEVHQLLLADAQTSGGLVFGVDPSETETVLAELTATGHQAALIGTTSAGYAWRHGALTPRNARLQQGSDPWCNLVRCSGCAAAGDRADSPA